ncbi:MAG: ABC transporter ATP-binding protein [Bacillota bacterium]|nr:MAG: ABC transporter ATP-binding protein [Bacillota bacterium]
MNVEAVKIEAVKAEAVKAGARNVEAATVEPSEFGKETVLSARNLSTYYRTKRRVVKACEAVNLDLYRGEVYSLVGESACGKSTLGATLMNLVPDGTEVTGEIVFRGRNVLTLSKEELRRLRGTEIALIFQDPMTRLDPLMTIEKHFVEALQSHEPISRREAALRGARALDAVGVPPSRLRDYPHQFSGGMRQRIMIALALVFEPVLLVSDEATTSLDVVVQAQILHLMRSLKDRYGLAILNITHDLGVVAEISDKVGVMYGGHVVEQGTALEVFHRPAHPYTGGLLNSVVHMGTTQLSWIDGMPPDLGSPPPGCPYADRCDLESAECHRSFPPESRLSATHRVHCHRVAAGLAQGRDAQ